SSSSSRSRALKLSMRRKRDATTARGRSGGLGLSWDRRPVPGQQLVDAINRMVGDAGDDVAEPGFGVDVVQAGGLYERVHYGGAPPSAVRRDVMMPGV